MPTVLITGANRGLGLEFVRQYLRDGWRVIAACRNPQQATELNALKAVNNRGRSIFMRSKLQITMQFTRSPHNLKERP